MMWWLPIIECIAAFVLVFGLGIHTVIETLREANQRHASQD